MKAANDEAVVLPSRDSSVSALAMDVDYLPDGQDGRYEVEIPAIEEIYPATLESMSTAMTFAEISRILWSAGSVLDTLQRIVNYAVKTVEGCDGAGISFIQGDAIITPVWTEQKVFVVDTLQYMTGEGPCLDAIEQETVFCSEDLLSDPRWPTFGPRAAAHQVRSVLSLRLLGSRTLGALNLYARMPGAYSLVDQAMGLVFAAHAGIALAAAGDLERTARDLTERTTVLTSLVGALRVRDVIGQAQGRLMQGKGLTADQAFTLLRRASQHLNIKLRDVADCVARTGEVPERHPGPATTG